MGAGLRVGWVSTGLGFRLFGPHGSVKLTEVGEGIVLLELEGIAYAAFCERLFTALEIVADKAGELTLFLDASRLRSYETEFRRLWTEWLQVHRDSLRACVALACSPMIRMWIDVVNVVTGGLLYSVDERSALERLMYETALESAPRLRWAPLGSGPSALPSAL
jgi:hypothetical protein